MIASALECLEEAIMWDCIWIRRLTQPQSQRSCPAEVPYNRGIRMPINCSRACSDAVSTDHVQRPNTLQGRVGVWCQAEPTALQQGLEAVLPGNGNQGTNRLGHFLLYFSILFLRTVLSPLGWENWCSCCRNTCRQTPTKRNRGSSRRGFRGYYVLCVSDFILNL